MKQTNKGFNLVTEDWIPVTGLKGEHSLIGLRELFINGNSYRDLAVRPHERVALMRLLLCIAHAALDGPDDLSAWQKVPDQLPSRAPAYLDKWQDSFDLFHPAKPFLQMKNIKSAAKNAAENEGTGIAKLDFALACGNNTTLFDHQALSAGERIFSESRIILSLLAYQNFSPGGLISQVHWNKTLTNKSSKDAPCIPVSMYHAFIRGEHLLNTLHMNLLTKNDLVSHYQATGAQWWGRPIWELGQFSADDKEKIRTATETWLGRLVPLTRLILLGPERINLLMGDGLIYPTFTDPQNPFPAEASATVVIKKQSKKEEYTLLGCKPNKATWRELPAMLIKRAAGRNGGPLSLRNLDNERNFDLHILGVARDQANILDVLESVYHLPVQILTPDGLAVYEKALGFSEEIARKLGRAIEKYRKTYDGGWEGRVKSAGASKGALLGQLHSRATVHYWTTIENSLHVLWSHVEVAGISAERMAATGKAWQKAVYGAAREAYELVCGQETPRKMRAFALGWNVLNNRQAAKPESNKTELEEVLSI